MRLLERLAAVGIGALLGYAVMVWTLESRFEDACALRGGMVRATPAGLSCVGAQ